MKLCFTKILNDGFKLSFTRKVPCSQRLTFCHFPDNQLLSPSFNTREDNNKYVLRSSYSDRLFVAEVFCIQERNKEKFLDQLACLQETFAKYCKIESNLRRQLFGAKESNFHVWKAAYGRQATNNMRRK